jgi:hypothetical protein
MSSKYVPPALRKKQEVAPPIPPPEKNFDHEFPSVLAAPTSQRVWGGTASFADKAREWQLQSDKDSEDTELRKKVESDAQFPSIIRVLPKFNNVRHFVEHDESDGDSGDELPKQAPPPGDDSGWTLVERKLRKKRKTLTEIADDDLAKQSDDEHEDSVWNDEKQLYETCWDDTA